MGERRRSLFQAKFNRSVRVEAASEPLTEDTGALFLREVAELLGLPELIDELVDARDPSRVTFTLRELVMTRTLLIAQGWRDQDDADALRSDPALRAAVSDRKGDRALRPEEATGEPAGLASQPTLSRLTAILASEHNRRILSRILLTLARRRMLRKHGHQRIMVLDVDATLHETHGHQQGAAYNGYYEAEGYHPLYAFTDTGDLVGVMLRPGNTHSAKDVRRFLRPILAELREDCDQLWVRMDAGFSDGKTIAWLHTQGVRFLTRLPTNPVLTRSVERWTARQRRFWAENPSPDGEPREATREFYHRVRGWTFVVRVVSVLVERDAAQGELLDRQFFLATNLPKPFATSREILEGYRKRGAMEGLLGELKTTLDPHTSSVQRHRLGAPHRKRAVGFAENEVVLLISAIAYELLHAIRCLLVEGTDEGWSIQRVRERVLKVATVLIRHARSLTYRIAEAKQEFWRLIAMALPSLSGPEVSA